ncbi:hypothetical protein C1645_818488 [Glomus cerebriforme]|uniref:Uncharacterized protein n=1 Tax=Glomus cerebriforme TaxID=658196 RepID=A0A397T898_9GLOM|nr:hypothetical protein C1645_818488 [Glomus cerebriforme]
MVTFIIKEITMFYIIRFVVDQAQNDDNMFKSIKIVTTEFVGGEIQDLNFLPTSIANIKSPTTTTIQTSINTVLNDEITNDEDNDNNTPANIQTPARRKRTRK